MQLNYTASKAGIEPLRRREAGEAPRDMARAQHPRTELHPRRQRVRPRPFEVTTSCGPLRKRTLPNGTLHVLAACPGAMLTCHHSRRFAERPSITGFDPKKFAASAGNVKGDPWHR